MDKTEEPVHSPPVDMRALCGRNLAAQRVRRGWTQAQLAEVAGVGRSFISDIERGRTRVSLQDWVPLLEALDVDMAAILAGDEPEVARARRVLLGR